MSAVPGGNGLKVISGFNPSGGYRGLTSNEETKESPNQEAFMSYTDSIWYVENVKSTLSRTVHIDPEDYEYQKLLKIFDSIDDYLNPDSEETRSIEILPDKSEKSKKKASVPQGGPSWKPLFQ